MSEMSEQNERAYVEGNQAVWRSILGQAIAGLGYQDDAARHIAELYDVKAALRGLCGDLNCTDWPDDMHLGDVITGFLQPHITEMLAQEDPIPGPLSEITIREAPDSGEWQVFQNNVLSSLHPTLTAAIESLPLIREVKEIHEREH